MHIASTWNSDFYKPFMYALLWNTRIATMIRSHLYVCNFYWRLSWPTRHVSCDLARVHAVLPDFVCIRIQVSDVGSKERYKWETLMTPSTSANYNVNLKNNTVVYLKIWHKRCYTHNSSATRCVTVKSLASDAFCKKCLQSLEHWQQSQTNAFPLLHRCHRFITKLIRSKRLPVV